MRSKLNSITFLMFFLFWACAGVAQEIGNINFDFDSDKIDAQAQAQIEFIAKQLLEKNSYKSTVIVGFTDAVGTSGYNYDLGLRRAQAVSNAFREQGVEVGRIGTIESRGKTELLVAIPTPERLNRRVTVSLEDMLKACPSYRTVSLNQSAIGDELQSDLVAKLQTAVNAYNRFNANGANTPAYQMAGAAREDCGIAVGFDDRSVRKLEYSKKCFCNSARLQVALGNLPAN